MKMFIWFLLVGAGLLWLVPAQPGLNPAQALLDQLNGVQQAQIDRTCRSLAVSTGEENCNIKLMSPTELARLGSP